MCICNTTLAIVVAETECNWYPRDINICSLLKKSKKEKMLRRGVFALGAYAPDFFK
jgi:hypothetical protein